jgi:hypothetical protein
MNGVHNILAEPLFALTWVGFWIAASIIYRRSQGKPIYPRKPKDALYFESWVSGHSRRNIFTMMGGARNCLIVAVTPETFFVCPNFPFNLFFLPEVYGLEYEVPRKNIYSVKSHDGFFTKSVRIELESQPGERCTIQLYLKHRDKFLQALAPHAL